MTVTICLDLFFYLQLSLNLKSVQASTLIIFKQVLSSLRLGLTRLRGYFLSKLGIKFFYFLNSLRKK